MGEAVSVLVEGLPLCGTGHFISVDIFAPSFSLPGKPIPRLGRAGHDSRVLIVAYETGVGRQISAVVVVALLQFLQFR
jgi:hypothetical protein